jgi:hypothetical protein
VPRELTLLTYLEMSNCEDQSVRIELLRSRTAAFRNALLEYTPPPKILDDFVPFNPIILERGPHWARSRLPLLSHVFVRRYSQSRPS